MEEIYQRAWTHAFASKMTHILDAHVDVNVTTWEEFCREPGVADIVESIGMGPTSQYSDGRPGDNSIALRVSFTYPGAGPCTYEACYYDGPYGSPLWFERDPHAAMVADVRTKVVE